MSKDKKPDLYDLFNDDSLWGNQETDALSHEEIMDPIWNKRLTQSQKELWAQRNKNAVPDVIAISPEGKSYKFNSLAEVEEYLKCGPLFIVVPDDGMPYRGERRSKKNWIFYRDIPNKNRFAELKRLRKLVKEKTDTTLKMPWRSSKWRATPEGQKYLAELAKRRAQPNKKNKRIMTPDGMFESQQDAIRHYGFNPSTLRYKMTHYPESFYNCDENGNKLKS